MLPLPSVNFWAIIVSLIISFIIGGLWYSPKVLGSIWLKSVGMTEEQMKANPTAYLYTILNLLLTIFVLALFIAWTGAASIMEGAQIGFWAWLGFGVTTLMSGVIWEKMPLTAFVIHSGLKLIVFVISGAILAIWP